jgi:hypothetical protein
MTSVFATASRNRLTRKSVVGCALGLALACTQAPVANAADKRATKSLERTVELFRPEPGKFPALENAHTYRGEIVFIDHANRRGSIRVEGSGKFYRNDPHPFAMLPYGIVRLTGATADLRDVPLGTVMHAKAFLPPEPKTSAVPVLPPDSKLKDAGHYRGTGIFPAENHIALLEDEPSHCLREGLVWRLHELEINETEGTLTASREPRQGSGNKATPEKMTFDSGTRVWRGSERFGIQRLLAEKTWPTTGKKNLAAQEVLLGITWKPAPGDGLSGAFTRFHISDIWLDEAAIQQAAQLQTEAHKSFVRSRWMPAWVDDVKYGEFGRATVTATLFGGMDHALYADFKKDVAGQINGAENTLKHAGGHYGPGHLASNGKITDVTRILGEVPFCSSGIQVKFETDLIIEGIRPTRVIRIRPESWPKTQIPREEYVNDSLEERFPTPAIFPKY